MCVRASWGGREITTMSAQPERKLRGRREMKTEIKVKPKDEKPCMSSQGLWMIKRLTEVLTRTEVWLGVHSRELVR